jgi:hypothetical protein
MTRILEYHSPGLTLMCLIAAVIVASILVGSGIVAYLALLLLL